MGMPRKPIKARESTTTILIRDFPVVLHREMKAEAARRGVNVKALYAEAATSFLTKGGKGKGGA
jgi:hypothetical protein